MALLKPHHSPMIVTWFVWLASLGLVVFLVLFARFVSYALINYAVFGLGFCAGGFVLVCCYQFAHRMTYGRWF